MTIDTFAQQHNAIKEMGAQQERARIVEWLRSTVPAQLGTLPNPGSSGEAKLHALAVTVLLDIAERIARGEHLPPPE
jgi:hypothetical protein